MKPESFVERNAVTSRLAVFSAPIVALLVAVLIYTENDFTYTLDDPYIHLALAKNIYGGGYGVNPGEWSAPSSSIIWPFLLVPFAALPSVFELVPLAINAACVILSGFVVSNIFKSVKGIANILLTFVFLLGFNFYGLMFTGMEHNLHVLLALTAAYGLLNRERLGEDRFLRTLFYSSLILLPLVRYEGLAISVPLLVFMALKDDLKTAATASVLTAVPLAVFSLFLYSHDLGFLPSSVLAKSSHAGIGSTVVNIVQNLNQYGWLFVLVAVYFTRFYRGDRSLSGLLIAVSFLHLVFGKSGWFGRYEVYYVAFIAAFLLKDLVEWKPRAWRFALLLPFCLTFMNSSTALSAPAASNVKNQQGVMAAIARDLDESVAVNDLGLVALRGGNYVLDLWGLGSIDALRKRTGGEDPRWISGLMESKGVSYAIVYENWFADRPRNWIKVGELRLNGLRVSVAEDTVSFFATSESKACKMKKVLDEFRSQNPSEDFSINSTFLDFCP